MQVPETIEFRKVRDFGEVLNASFFFIRLHVKPLLLNLLFLAGPFILVGSVLPGLLVIPWISTFTDMPDGAAEGFSLSLFMSMLVNFLSFIVGSVMVAGTVYEYMLLYMQRSNGLVQSGEVWKAVRKDFFRILGTLTGLTIVAVSGFTIIGSLTFLILGPVAGMLAMLALGIFLTVSLSLVLIIRLYERCSLIKAIQRSYELTRTNWWQTFGLFVICYVVQSTLVWLVIMPFYLFLVSQQLFSNDSASMMASSLILATITGVLFILAVMVSFCMTLVVSAFQYFNLSERKDAGGLLAKIRSMGTPAAQLTHSPDDEDY
jgi:hypothetical protein